MDGGVSFTEVVARAEGVSRAAVEAGGRFAQYIPEPTTDTGLLNGALWWAAYVGKIVPLWHATDDRAKEARSDLLGVGWTADAVASNDLRQVQEWWTEAPWSNIGFATRANGILILDLDPRHDGIQKWRALCQRYAIDDSAVPRQASPRGDGGVHLWFRLPDGATFAHSPLARGIDRPWQVPVPPSMRVVTVDADAKDPARRTGLRPYRWLAGDPRALPLAPPVLYGEQLEVGQAGAGSAGSNAALPAELDADALVAAGGVPVGVQSYTFKRLACSMVRKGSDDASIVAELMDLARKSPLGDRDDPWTESHMWDFAGQARRYIARQDAEQAARVNASWAGLRRRIGS